MFPSMGGIEHDMSRDLESTYSLEFVHFLLLETGMSTDQTKE